MITPQGNLRLPSPPATLTFLSHLLLHLWWLVFLSVFLLLWLWFIDTSFSPSSTTPRPSQENQIKARAAKHWSSLAVPASPSASGRFWGGRIQPQPLSGPSRLVTKLVLMDTKWTPTAPGNNTDICQCCYNTPTHAKPHRSAAMFKCAVQTRNCQLARQLFHCNQYQ